MLVVVSQIVKMIFDVVLAAIVALEVRMLVVLFACNEFHHFAMSVCNELICSNRLMIMFTYLLILRRVL